MGILNNKNSLRNSKSSDDIFMENIQKVLSSIDNCEQSISIKICEDLISQRKDLFFSLNVSQNLLKRLIDHFYKVNNKSEAYECIALLALHEFSKSNMLDYLFTIAKLAFDNHDFDFAKGYIKTVYILSDGAYFYSDESKKMLNCIGINDNRTFDDFSQDY